jgi:hypothetical protein
MFPENLHRQCYHRLPQAAVQTDPESELFGHITQFEMKNRI